MNVRAFTLIELLIVVAIIAILVVIALPNFLQAQARARVARARGDIRSLATGLEAYAVDQGALPRGNYYQLSTRFIGRGANRGLVLLSTPVEYVSEGLIPDPFPTEMRDGGFTAPDPRPDDDPERHWYKYTAHDGQRVVGMTTEDRWAARTEWYLLQSSGPDHTRHTLGQDAIRPTAPHHFRSTIYDPSNGTISRGSLYRAGGNPTGVASFAFQMVARSQR